MIEIPLLRFALDDDEPIWFGEGEAAQKEIVDQTEDGGVDSDPERQG